MNLFIQNFIPLAVGYTGIEGLRRASFPLQVLRVRISPTVRSLVFLALQIALLLRVGHAGVPGVIAVGLTLTAFAVLTGKSSLPSPAACAHGALASFTAYLAYWGIEKYALSAAIRPSILTFFPPFANVAPDLEKLALVGVSYIGFKLIHYYVDFRNGTIRNANPVEVLGWLLFFPSIVAGPMMRFQDWEQQRKEPSVTLDQVREGLQRLISGLFVKVVLADSIHGAAIDKMNPGTLSQASFAQLFLAAVVYSLYLYLDFSAYSRMAIGTGLFFGIRLPENFNNPFVSRNLSEFWNRWHISLSAILRDYLFYPLSLFVKRSPFWRRFPATAAAIPPLVTFLLAGIWHGAGVNFALYGLLHGAGLAYLAIAARRKSEGAFARWWKESFFGYAISAAMTFLYVTLSFVFFALPWSSLRILMHRLFFQ